MKQAFTLIELLVVVLIIGILAAVALPQYQKAVWKSRTAQMTTLVSSLGHAAEAYILANGTCPADWDEMDLSIDWENVTDAPCSFGIEGTRRAKGPITLALGGTSCFVAAAFNEGPYVCGGFVYILKDDFLPAKTYCWDYNTAFCTKMFGLSKSGTRWGWDIYEMP